MSLLLWKQSHPCLCVPKQNHASFSEYNCLPFYTSTESGSSCFLFKKYLKCWHLCKGITHWKIWSFLGKLSWFCWFHFVLHSCSQQRHKEVHLAIIITMVVARRRTKEEQGHSCRKCFYTTALEVTLIGREHCLLFGHQLCTSKIPSLAYSMNGAWVADRAVTRSDWWYQYKADSSWAGTLAAQSVLNIYLTRAGVHTSIRKRGVNVAV